MSAPTPPAPVRGPERRQAHLGPPADGERRVRLDDRRGEHNRLHVSFRLRDVTFILAIEQVREVVQVQEVVRVPLAPGLVAGLINLRGEIVPAIDLRPLLGGTGAAGAPASAGAALAGPGADMLVVVRAEAGAFGLVVDEVHDVLAVSPTMLAEPPANLPAVLVPLAGAVCKLPDRLLLVLDVQGVVHLVDSPRVP